MGRNESHNGAKQETETTFVQIIFKIEKKVK